MKKKVIIIVLLCCIVGLSSFIVYLFVDDGMFIKRNCGIHIGNGTIVNQDHRQEDEITKYHYYTVKYEGDCVEELTKRIEDSGYALNWYVVDVRAPWWPESEDYYHKYGPNRLFGIIRLNNCGNTAMVHLSEDGDTYLYIGCMEMGNLWVAAGIA